MSRIHFAAALLALGLATPTFAHEGERSFTRDGITYTYTSTRTGDTLVLEGIAKPTGGKFRFVVRDGRVTGYAGDVRVNFLVAKALRESGIVSVAAR